MGLMHQSCSIMLKQPKLLNLVGLSSIFRWWLQQLQWRFLFHFRISWMFQHLQLFILWFMFLIRSRYLIRLICFQHLMSIIQLWHSKFRFLMLIQWFRWMRSQFFYCINRFLFHSQLHLRRVFNQLLIS